MDKYLEKYAEHGSDLVKDMPAGEPWQQVIVIPVCNESTRILRPLPPGPGRSLMILVVNEAEGSPRHVSAANRKFATEVRTRFRLYWQSAADSGIALHRDPDSPRDVLLMDRYSEGLRLPPKGGVGHARKAGADLAMALIRESRVASSWIHCSDADVRLPERYFVCSAATAGDAAKEISALVFPFQHVPSGGDLHGDIVRVTRLYEYSLRYYVAGLAYARSPYAFHTIGSTVAVNAAHYARVRGFPRRQAGEDFYLLNKLAKVGSIRQLRAGTDCEPIQISARLSDRVPFGTGAATGRIIRLEDPAREFLLYHPGVFELLRSWLNSLPIFWQSQSTDPGTVLSKPDLNALIDGLNQLGANLALQHALRQSSDSVQFHRQMHTWFDAFRTLKLIHYVRDHHLPSIPYKVLMTEQNTDHLMGHEPTLPKLHRTSREDWLGSC